MSDFFACIRRDLLRIVPLAVDHPDATGSSPGRVHGDELAIWGIRRVKCVLDKSALFARCQIAHPYIPILKLTENVAGLQLHAGLTSAHKRNLFSVRRPSWLEFVKITMCQLRILPGCQVFPKDLAGFTGLPCVQQVSAVRRPRGILFDSLSEGHLGKRGLQSRPRTFPSLSKH